MFLILVFFFFKISNLIASEILHCEDINTRVTVMEKWVAVADICRCLHNYNAVLEITSSLNRSSIFRLKKTWLKVSKQVHIHGKPSSGKRHIWLWNTRIKRLCHYDTVLYSLKKKIECLFFYLFLTCWNIYTANHCTNLHYFYFILY